MFKQSTFKNWDFENVWAIKENEGSMPYLRSVGVESDVLKENFTYMPIEGEGTQANPYIIETTEEFQKMNLFVNDTVYFKLGCDLDFSEVENFAPIGNNANPFKGHLDGDNYKISNLNIKSASQYVGIFGYIDAGTVKNLTIENINVNATNTTQDVYVGGLTGYANIATLNNVKVVGTNEIVNVETSNT